MPTQKRKTIRKKKTMSKKKTSKKKTHWSNESYPKPDTPHPQPKKSEVIK